MVTDNDVRQQEDDATGELLRQLLEDDAGHLTYDQLEALIDGQLAADEIATAEAHMSRCQSCRTDLTHLRGIAAQVIRAEGAEMSRHEAGTAEPVTWRSWFASMFEWWPQTARPAYALVAIVLLAAASGWLALSLRDERQTASARQRLGDAERNAAQAEIDRLSRELQERAEPPTSTPPQQVPPNSVVAFSLAPGVFRAADVRQLELAAGASAVRFTLTTDLEARAPRFQVILRLATGQEVWRSSWSSVSGPPADAIDVVIPAAVLASGQYVLEWSAAEVSGQFEPLEDYAFAIVRRQ